MRTIFSIEGMSKTDALRQKYVGSTWGPVELGGLNEWDIRSRKYWRDVSWVKPERGLWFSLSGR